MPVTVKTVITNNKPQVYSIQIARGKNCNVRGGETVTLDFDIWSYLSRYSRKLIERDISRGILSVSTKVYTGDNTINVNSDGVISMRPGGEEIEPKTVVVAKPKLTPVKEEKNKDLLETKTVIASKSADKMTSKVGAKIVDMQAVEEPVKEATTGFTVIKAPEEAKLHNDIEDRIDELYSVKDYDMIYAAMCDAYPDTKFTKLGIKKAYSYKELKEKFAF